MRPVIVPIVEGQSEVESVPVLVRRILNQLGAHHLQPGRPWRVKRNRVVRAGELERAVTQAVHRRVDAAALLVLLDADDDCPAALGPRLLERCRWSTRILLILLPRRPGTAIMAEVRLSDELHGTA